MIGIAVSWLFVAIAAYWVWELVSAIQIYCYVNICPPHPVGRMYPKHIRVKDIILFSIVRANFVLHYFNSVIRIALLYLGFNRRAACDQDVVNRILNASVVLWTSASTRSSDGKLQCEFAVDNFLFPEIPGLLRKYAIRVQFEHDIGQGWRIITFLFDGKEISSNSRRLEIMSTMVSCVIHPIVHGYVNDLHESRSALSSSYSDMFLHSQYLNYVAHFFPSFCFAGDAKHTDWYSTVLHHNANIPVPKHATASLEKLKEHSRYLRFLLPSRRVVIRLLGKYEIKVDQEAFFVCSFVHSIDHYLVFESAKGILVGGPETPKTTSINAAEHAFLRPCNYFCTNLLKAKVGKSPFYAELYAEVAKIDQELADQVTLSISY